MTGHNFDDMKKAHFVEAHAKSISLTENEFLIPLGPWALIDHPEIINEMWLWRCSNARHFFFDQHPTLESYTKYVADGPLLTKERILFLVFTGTKFVGHLGLAVYKDGLATIDNVLRGVDVESAQIPGIMERAMEAMISWAQDIHGILAFDLEVRSDNTRAIKFYERLGFAATGHFEFEHNDNYLENDLRQHSPLQRIVMQRFISTVD